MFEILKYFSLLTAEQKNRLFRYFSDRFRLKESGEESMQPEREPSGAAGTGTR